MDQAGPVKVLEIGIDNKEQIYYFGGVKSVSVCYIYICCYGL